MSQSIPGYRAAASKLKPIYAGLNPTQIYASVQDVAPKPGEHVLDVGAGTGRDTAAWAAAGCLVTAVEPVTELWAFPDLPVIQDQLPHLEKLANRRLSFDVTIITGVWHHLSEDARDSAVPVLYALLKKDGRAIISLRNGATPHSRPGFAVNPSREAHRFLNHGFEILFQRHAHSIQAKNVASSVSWTWLAMAKHAD